MLKGKTALITGAGRGIGREIALKMASQGASVIIADIDEKTMEAVKDEASGLGVKSMAAKMDISNSNSVATAIGKVLEEFGSISLR